MTKVICIKNFYLVRCMVNSNSTNFLPPASFLVEKDTIWYFTGLDYIILSSLDGGVIGLFEEKFEDYFMYLRDWRDDRINEIFE